MKRTAMFFLTALICTVQPTFAQTAFKDHKVGHIFHVSLPEYMTKTLGLNSAAHLQYKSVVKDVYGFIIEDGKEELRLAEMHFSSLKEFYEEFIKDFLKDQETRKISHPTFITKGEINVVQCDASYFDKDAQIEIYYLVGIVETKTSYYKVLSWSAAEKKDKFKEDFQKILYSIKD